jgi:catechol 2,3-dioxygenase
MAEIDPGLRIAGVSLAVADLARSVDFYERVLGLGLLARDEGTATLAASTPDPAGASVLTLSQLPAAVPASPRASGLFHVAWLHPSRGALADSVRRVAGAGWRFDGASDHGVSEAMYLSDPDGLGIELYADRPREAWQRSADGHGVRMYTLPLDLEDLLAQGDEDQHPVLAPGTIVGHVHLKVADVPRANAFYRDALGFGEQAQIPSAAFLGAGGYHHHVGLNSWQSAGMPRAGADEPGLRLVEFVLPGEGAVEALERGSRDAGANGGQTAERDADGSLRITDPDGQPLRFAAAG